MPLKPYAFSTTPDTEHTEPTFLDKLRGLAAGGVRVGSGLIGSTVATEPGIGTFVGAGIGGAGEALAEQMEGSKSNWKRIAAEAALTAVPLGKVYQSGKVIQSALRGTGYAGAGVIGRQLAEDQPVHIGPWEAGNIALGGGLGALFGRAGKLPPSAGPRVEVETTARTGPGTSVLSGGKIKKGVLVGAKSAPSTAPESIPATGDISSLRLIGPQPKPSGGAIPYKPPTGPGPIPEQPDVQYPLSERATARRTLAAEAKAARTSRKSKGEWLADEQAQTADDTRQETLRPPSAVEQVPTQVTEPKADIGAQVPEGAATPPLPEVQPFTKPKATAGERFNKRATKIADFFGVPAATPVTRIVDEGLPFASDKPETWVVRGHLDDRKAAQLNDMYKGGKGVVKKGNIEGSVNFNATDEFGNEIAPVKTEGMTFTPRLSEVAEATPHVTPMESAVETIPESNLFSVSPLEAHTMASEEPSASEAPGALAQFFKTKQGATGKNYRLAKDAAAAGEIPTAGYARDSHLIAQGKPPEGPLAASTAPEAPTPLPEAPIAPEAPGGQSGPPPPDYPAATTPEAKWDLLNKLKGLGPGGSAKGAINPALLTRLGLGAAGALVGGATDPLDDPLLSAAAGGLAGAAIPSIPGVLRQLGAAPHTLENLEENIKTPEGIKATARNIWQTLPQIQRFNYLADASGLPANALFGPYGSALFGALEYHLSGDPRGTEVLRNLNPATFFKEFWASRDEAMQLIEHGELGRAEHLQLGKPNEFTSVLSMPAYYMTAGDVAARNVLERAGFTEAEARRLTLTSEPELAAPKSLVGLGKKSPLLQLLLPFKRTLANIGEQGSYRIPGLGFITQSMRKAPDTMRQQVVQQALGTGIGTAAGVAGATLDPETAKTARRYVTNVAGPYSLPASIGFTMGQAVQAGKPMLSSGITRGIQESLPLPSTAPLTEWTKFLTGEGPLPRGAAPSIVRDFLTPGTSKLGPLPRIRR